MHNVAELEQSRQWKEKQKKHCTETSGTVQKTMKARITALFWLSHSTKADLKEAQRLLFFPLKLFGKFSNCH